MFRGDKAAAKTSESPISTNTGVTPTSNSTIPISTVVIIPINAGLLGSFDIDVPIRTIVPVNLDITIPVSQTVDIATTVPLDVAVPIEIPLAETPLAGYMEELDTALARLEESLVRLGGKLANPLSRGDE